MYEHDLLQLRPGRVAALILPPAEETDAATAEAAIRRAVQLAASSGVQLIQSLLPMEASCEAAWLARCGFSDLGEVLYLVWSCDLPIDDAAGPAIECCSVDRLASGEHRLQQVLQATYEGSRDCAAMNDPRSIDDILDSHRHVGQFAPELWFVVRSGDADAGCLLLSEHRPSNEWEVVYLGVVPAFRGRGLGMQIVRHAQRLAQCRGAALLSAAVDAANQPATAVYFACGFEIRRTFRLFVRAV